MLGICNYPIISLTSHNRYIKIVNFLIIYLEFALLVLVVVCCLVGKIQTRNHLSRNFYALSNTSDPLKFTGFFYHNTHLSSQTFIWYHSI